jgi:hypothetical protein
MSSNQPHLQYTSHVQPSHPAGRSLTTPQTLPPDESQTTHLLRPSYSPLQARIAANACAQMAARSPQDLTSVHAALSRVLGTPIEDLELAALHIVGSTADVQRIPPSAVGKSEGSDRLFVLEAVLQSHQAGGGAAVW